MKLNVSNISCPPGMSFFSKQISFEDFAPILAQAFRASKPCGKT